MGVTKEAVIVNKDKHELMTLSPEFDPQVREVVLETRFGPDDKYHRPINEEKFLDILGQRVGLVVRDGEIIPVIVGLNRPLVLKKPLGRGIRESVPTKDEQRAIEEINQLTAAHLKINFQATVAEKVLALEQMADQLPGPLKDFKLDAKTRKRLQGDAQRTGLIPVNQMLTDLAAMELEPVAGTGVNYEDTPVDIILDKVSNKIAKFFPSRIKMVGEAAPTGQKDRDLPESPASGGGSKRISFPAKTGDVVFDRQMRTVKTVLISSSVLAGTAIFLAFCGPRIINAIDGTPVDVEPTQVYLPTPTEQPLPTPDISIVAGMETPTAESTVEAPTQEIGQPTVWTPPTFEQLTAKGGPVPEDTNKKMDDLKQAVEGRISGATAYHPLWNGGYADDTRIQIYGSNQEGIIWQVNADGSFNEYPVTVAADPQTVFKFMEGQKFELIEGSENAFVVFTGAGAGEKLAVVRNEIVLADGKTKVCLEYLNFQTKEWEINPNVLAAMLPEGSQNNLIWQDENGQWLAGQAGTEQAILQFDLAKKAWVEALPPLPEEFLSQIPADKQYKIVNGQVLVDGQAWFEMNSAGEWEKSDWKLLADAPNQNFWGGKYEIERVLRQDIWPLLTGENWEVTKEINGQPVVIKGRLGVIPNPYQKGEILKVLIPFRFEWGDGLSSNVWVITKTEEKNIDYFLQLPSGEQVFITGTVDSSHRPAECVFGTRCGWWYDIADLSADFFLNGVTPNEPVIVSPVDIGVKEYLLSR